MHLFTLAFIISSILSKSKATTQCALAVSWTPGSHTVFTIDLNTSTIYHYGNESVVEGTESSFAATAINRDTNTLYAINFEHGNFYSYNIITETETEIGILSTDLKLNALDFKDGILYAHKFKTTEFLTINPLTLQTKLIGYSSSRYIRTLKLSKNNEYIYYATNKKLFQVPMNNITSENEIVLIDDYITQLTVNNSGLIDAMDWLNDDISDNRLVICYSKHTNSYNKNAECYIYNLNDLNSEPVFLVEIELRYIQGFEMLYGEYDNCDILPLQISGKYVGEKSSLMDNVKYVFGKENDNWFIKINYGVFIFNIIFIICLIVFCIVKIVRNGKKKNDGYQHTKNPDASVNSEDR